MNARKMNELLTVSGFMKFFFSVIRDNPDMTQTDAYERVEQVYKESFGKRRYSCFDSFRQVKTRYLKMRK